MLSTNHARNVKATLRDESRCPKHLKGGLSTWASLEKSNEVEPLGAQEWPGARGPLQKLASLKTLGALGAFGHRKRLASL